ncbi:Ras-related protein Rab-19 [Oopsacas minuta]|uniref:Ras-related protein Rab-19 n=1 Tax=Oopsacas minuta TaxID=111878 RepID=A0AAV7K6C3_9METZ|nr:Ras-related protein Rab-19 [Oopsacas minuta]
MATEVEFPRYRSFKIILIGNAGVGKTSLIQRYSEGYFHDSSLHKVLKHDFVEKDVLIDRSLYRFVVWDTAGQEKYKSVTRSLYHNVDGVIFVYDVTNTSSYVDLKSWLGEIRDYLEPLPNTCIFLANKCDRDVSEQLVTFSQLKNDPDFSEFMYKYETSALTGDNVGVVFDTLQREIVKKRGGDIDRKYQEIANKHEYTPPSCAC